MSTHEPIDEARERLLRAALAAHAPDRIDTDAAWRAVTSQLIAPAGDALTPPVRRRMSAPAGWVGRPRHALVAAILIAVLLASLGSVVGFAYSRGCFFGGSPFLCSNFPQPAVTDYFDKVNQSQELHGVTVTITSAYADRGATLIGYRATMTPDLAAQWQAADPLGMTVTADSGEVALFQTKGPGAIVPLEGLCDASERNQGATVCYFTYGPLHPGDTASSVSVSVEIPEIQLHNGPTDTVLAGPWRFHFTLTFHQVTRDLDSSR